jgi:hypothetical protein
MQPQSLSCLTGDVLMPFWESRSDNRPDMFSEGGLHPHCWQELILAAADAIKIELRWFAFNKRGTTGRLSFGSEANKTHTSGERKLMIQERLDAKRNMTLE